jgi:hypothetical protein
VHIVVTHGFFIQHTSLQLGDTSQAHAGFCAVTAYRLGQGTDPELIVPASDSHVATKSKNNCESLVNILLKRVIGDHAD